MPLTPSVRTALIFANPLLGSGLQHILQDTPFVLAETASALDLGRGQPLALEPTLVIIEASRNTGCMLEIVRQVREQHPETLIVALTDRIDVDFVRQGHEAGVNGFCSAASSPDVLITCFELVMLGESVFPGEILHSMMEEVPPHQDEPIWDDTAGPSMSDLTSYKPSAREAEILRYLMDGVSNRGIASKLDITEATIKTYVKAILRKLGVGNRTQAAMWASQRLPQRGRASVNG